MNQLESWHTELTRELEASSVITDAISVERRLDQSRQTLFVSDAISRVYISKLGFVGRKTLNIPVCAATRIATLCTAARLTGVTEDCHLLLEDDGLQKLLQA